MASTTRSHSQADLGITVAGGSDLAHASGQASLLDGDLHRLVSLLLTARTARRRIAMALTWSFGYNTIGLLLAASGLLTPAFAAIAMVVSSAVTIAIASRRLNGGASDGAADVQPAMASPPTAPSTTPRCIPNVHLA